MKFQVEDVTVYFPYDHIYPEQYAYMLELKRALDAKGHCLLEMPTGTGKTIALLSLITSYTLSKPQNPVKLIYCTRTVHEMEKTLAELKLLHNYQVKHLGPQAQILAVGLSSRKNLCVNPTVLAAENRDSVDAACRKLTASWVRNLAAENPNVQTCEFFEEYERAGSGAVLPPGVYTLQDLRAYGKQKGWCPYFLARHMVQFSNVVVYSYQYMLDPKVAGIISKEMQKESVVVFDEAHNIDNVCIEALSVSVRRQTIEGARRNLSKMQHDIERFKATDADRLRKEYNRLVEGLAQGGNLPITDTWLQNPALPDDILKEAVPGNIRKADHFVHVLRRLVNHLEGRLETENVEKEGPVSFVATISTQAGIDQKTLKFCYDRLHSLMMTLEITDTDEFLHIQTICDFATLVGTYTRGFSIIIEPFDERMPHIPDPVLQLCCHDASLAIKPVFDRFQSVVITSGTLSPIDLYPRLLNFHPVVSRSFTMSLTRDCICPMVLTRGSDQLPVSTKYDMRSDLGVVRNYGRLLLEMVSAVPDGVVCFFVSYSYMDMIVNSWNENGILKEIMQHKLVFIETQDVVETTLAPDNYRKACDCGRGAVFLSVARGKVAEGIDFDRYYGRLVIMFGIPFQYTLSKILLAQLEYLREVSSSSFGCFGGIRKRKRIFQGPEKREMDGQTPKTSSSKKPNVAKSSIDVYAAQCDQCKKWRVIHSEEEYEEIRSKISTEPFYCNKKSGVTCDDAADIEYSASRTWVIDKPDLPKTPEGFRRHLVARKDYSKLDTYFITPKGKRLRSRNEMAAFLKQNRKYEGLSASDFDFAPPKVMEDTVPEIFSKRGSDSVRKKIKMTKNEDKSADITGDEDFE